MTRPAAFGLLFLFGFIAACSGVETGAVSPCQGKFHPMGKYFEAKTAADGSTVVISTMNAPAAGCAD
jgi:hypothetical protein